jgi:TPP-dependent pyruvate/acetoin dehydrogenase alpha subunit
MMDRGWIEAAQLEELRASLRTEVDEAIVWAENSPYPGARELLDNVYEKR